MLLSDVCLSVCLTSVAYIRPKSRTEKTKIGTEVAHVTGDSDTTFRVKRSKVKVAALVGCSSHYITYIDSTPPPRASRCLSNMNIHMAQGALGAAGVRRV